MKLDNARKTLLFLLLSFSVAVCFPSVPARAADLQPALVETFGNEGGYQCSTGDPGNWTGGKIGSGILKGTKYGIAANTYPREDIRNLTLARAARLYKRDFWGALRLGGLRNQIIANEVFDGAVNMGAGFGPRWLQSSINAALWPRPGIPVDGKIGPATIAAANSCNQADLYTNLIGQRYGRYLFLAANSEVHRRNFKGWIRRVKANVVRVVLQTEGH